MKPLLSEFNSLVPLTNTWQQFSNAKLEDINYYIHDHLGNTRINYNVTVNNCEETIDGDILIGKVYTLNHVGDYFPYGKVLREFSSTPKEKYLTTHHERDQETGLDYRGARFYDSDIAKFLSVDFLSDKQYNEAPYTYVGNNPIYYIDPDGNIKRDPKGNVIFTPFETPINRPAYMKHESKKGYLNAVIEGVIYANDGTPIIAKRNNNPSEYKGFDTDCHGVTFTNGEFWINNDQVDALLKGDGYASINITDVRKGDILVYRDNEGEVEHSVTVLGYNKQGEIIVEGLGGVQTKTSITTADNGWFQGAKQTYYRKTVSEMEERQNSMKEIVPAKIDNAK